jgi:hypothetical protein
MATAHPDILDPTSTHPKRGWYWVQVPLLKNTQIFSNGQGCGQVLGTGVELRGGPGIRRVDVASINDFGRIDANELILNGVRVYPPPEGAHITKTRSESGGAHITKTRSENGGAPQGGDVMPPPRKIVFAQTIATACVVAMGGPNRAKSTQRALDELQVVSAPYMPKIMGHLKPSAYRQYKGRSAVREAVRAIERGPPAKTDKEIVSRLAQPPVINLLFKGLSCIAPAALGDKMQPSWWLRAARGGAIGALLIKMGDDTLANPCSPWFLTFVGPPAPGVALRHFLSMVFGMVLWSPPPTCEVRSRALTLLEMWICGHPAEVLDVANEICQKSLDVQKELEV